MQGSRKPNLQTYITKKYDLKTGKGLNLEPDCFFSKPLPSTNENKIETCKILKAVFFIQVPVTGDKSKSWWEEFQSYHRGHIHPQHWALGTDITSSFCTHGSGCCQANGDSYYQSCSPFMWAPTTSTHHSALLILLALLTPTYATSLKPDFTTNVWLHVSSGVLLNKEGHFVTSHIL